MTSTTPVTSRTLTVPDGSLYYEVRGSGPLLAFVGSPMDSVPFIPVADLLASDFTVLTLDPRGHGKSIVNDREQDSTPELRADDLARIIADLDAGPAIVIGSSGGAITGLALALYRPEVMTTLIAHEPPLRELLDDRAELRAEGEDITATYLAGDRISAIRRFIASTGLTMPEAVFEHLFGGERTPEQLADERFFYVHELPYASWRPDLDGLRATSTRIIIGIGDTSTDLFCDRTSRALGAALDIEPTMFPGDHTGFMEDPEAFAKRVREVLQDN
ncbi:alpha/beta fold hydrolase [Nocardia sp. SYP-A9097]|uniref:alpha/beta fold hydrolase n=1 Tax=Nocardia sp. SYP-A9097 TaxID=2663237 RepID=UPI00129A8528|nr:alpha/beta hydrolase [Nocardia sp. SYP-A9097]MRH90576.1 alpha/beta fold hydrolase [Nocardia sp. SYP-A9097]